MRKIFTLLVICVIANIASAQLHVVPNANTNTASSGSFLGPLANTSRTYQMLINENQLTALLGKELTGITWRVGTSISTAWPTDPTDYATYNISLGESVPPANRSLAAFTDNVVGSLTQVRSGSLSIRANDYSVGGNPNAFGSTINFDVPWLYTGGHLLVQINHTGSNGTSRSLEAITSSSTSAGYGTNFSACWQGTGAILNGNFTVTAFAYQDVMPVKLTSFIAVPSESRIKLMWTTASEINSNHFVIERSTDARSFNEVSRISAAGNTTAENRYEYLDNNIPANPIIYYRLKMVDKDGSFTYSSIARVVLNQKESSLTAYPNPVADKLTVSFVSNEKEQVNYHITSMDGKKQSAGFIIAEKGVNTFNINTVDLAKGVYVLVLHTGTMMQQVKIIKE